MSHWVYILASRRGGTLYVGVTNDLIRRTYEHREGLVPGFTKRYEVKALVYTSRTIAQWWRSSARRISNIGRVSGRSILSFRSIRNGVTYTTILSAETSMGMQSLSIVMRGLDPRIHL